MSRCSQGLMLPLYKTIGPREVKLLLIATAGVVCVAAVPIAHYQRLQVGWKLSAKRFLVGPPDLIDDVPQILRDKRIAIRMDLVRRVADLDARTWISRPGESRGKRKIEFSQSRAFECFEGVWILPIEFRHPEVHVVFVLQLNVPGVATARFRPVETIRRDACVQGIGRAGHVMSGAQIRPHSHPCGACHRSLA